MKAIIQLRGSTTPWSRGLFGLDSDVGKPLYLAWRPDGRFVLTTRPGARHTEALPSPSAGALAGLIPEANVDLAETYSSGDITFALNATDFATMHGDKLLTGPVGGFGNLFFENFWGIGHFGTLHFPDSDNSPASVYQPMMPSVVAIIGTRKNTSPWKSTITYEDAAGDRVYLDMDDSSALKDWFDHSYYDSATYDGGDALFEAAAIAKGYDPALLKSTANMLELGDGTAFTHPHAKVQGVLDRVHTNYANNMRWAMAAWAAKARGLDGVVPTAWRVKNLKTNQPIDQDIEFAIPYIPRDGEIMHIDLSELGGWSEDGRIYYTGDDHTTATEVYRLAAFQDAVGHFEQACDDHNEYEGSVNKNTELVAGVQLQTLKQQHQAEMPFMAFGGYPLEQSPQHAQGRNSLTAPVVQLGDLTGFYGAVAPTALLLTSDVGAETATVTATIGGSDLVYNIMSEAGSMQAAYCLMISDLSDSEKDAFTDSVIAYYSAVHGGGTEVNGDLVKYWSQTTEPSPAREVEYDIWDAYHGQPHAGHTYWWPQYTRQLAAWYANLHPHAAIAESLKGTVLRPVQS